MVLWCCHLSLQKICLLFSLVLSGSPLLHPPPSAAKLAQRKGLKPPSSPSVYQCIGWEILLHYLSQKYLAEHYTSNLRLFLMCTISRVKWTGKLIEKSSYSAGFVYTEVFPYVSVNAEHNWVCLGMETFFLHNLSINHVCGRVHFTRNSFLSILAKNPQCKPPPFSLLLVALILLSKMFCLAAEK